MKLCIAGNELDITFDYPAPKKTTILRFDTWDRFFAWASTNDGRNAIDANANVTILPSGNA